MKVSAVSVGHKALDSWLRNIKVLLVAIYCLLSLNYSPRYLEFTLWLASWMMVLINRPGYWENGTWIHCQFPNCFKNICMLTTWFGSLLTEGIGITEKGKKNTKRKGKGLQPSIICLSFVTMIVSGKRWVRWNPTYCIRWGLFISMRPGKTRTLILRSCCSCCC